MRDITRDADGGWMIHFNNRYYHVTESWCDDMWRHQFKHGNSPGFNRLTFLVKSRSTNTAAVDAAFVEAMGQKPPPLKRNTTEPTNEFRAWMKEQRANR